MFRGNLNPLRSRLRERRLRKLASARKSDSTPDAERTIPSDNPDTLVGAARAARSGMYERTAYTRLEDRQPDGD
jgi:HAMP domain-containing protein